MVKGGQCKKNWPFFIETFLGKNIVTRYMATKTYDRGICRHCGKDVEWIHLYDDYTTDDGVFKCLKSGDYDHDPLPSKSDNFNSLYEKLNNT